MKLAGFNFTKINVEKFTNDFKNLKINTSINLVSIDEAKTIKTNDSFLNLKFNYSIDYDPKIAKIEFEGNMLISIDSKKAKEILDDWKNKKIKDESRLAIFNGILMKSNIKAVQIESEMGLPIHFKLPSLTLGKKE